MGTPKPTLTLNTVRSNLQALMEATSENHAGSSHQASHGHPCPTDVGICTYTNISVSLTFVKCFLLYGRSCHNRKFSFSAYVAKHWETNYCNSHLKGFYLGWEIVNSSLPFNGFTEFCRSGNYYFLQWGLTVLKDQQGFTLSDASSHKESHRLCSKCRVRTGGAQS